MNYAKPALSINDQIERLRNRGLTINDYSKATFFLTNVSYYRIRAYTFPFQDNIDPNHPFLSKIAFEDIIALYFFDRKLRLLLLKSIEEIEISFRTQIIHNWSISYGSHWQLDASLFRNTIKYNSIKTRLDDEVKRSKEDFIQHYKSNYIKPVEPPCWMSLEVSSFGLLSIIFENLNKGIEKSSIVKHYRLNSIDVLENWFHAISNIRNLCAHHSRLWNRRMITHIKLPTNPKNTFIVNHAIKPYKLYAVVCCIKYLLDSINPSHTFKDDLLKTINEYSNKDTILKEMGFPENWLDEKFWQ